MSKISIFTPTHRPKHILEAYDSIKDQDFDEWVILYNNGAQPVAILDPRVKHIKATTRVKGVGHAKKLACAECTGDILLELDHDDLLAYGAIYEVRAAFEDPETGFVYSNSVPVNMDFSSRVRFGEAFGWKYETLMYNKKNLDMPIAFPPTPASVSRIWYAPDHLRAFRREVYDKVGGYDEELKVLDDLDIMCRMYLETNFYHINEGLYIYRVHDQNAWLKNVDAIQVGVWPIYDKYIENMALHWANVNCLDCIDLGGRLNKVEGYLSVDRDGDVDIHCDLEGRWPFEDSSVGVVRAFDIFEHLHDPIGTMQELQRVLAPGGYAFIQVPSTDGRGAFQDPTHVSYWNENSFLYYTDANWAKYIDAPVRFQAMRMYTTEANEQQVKWTVAHLVNLKDGIRPPGLISI